MKRLFPLEFNSLFFKLDGKSLLIAILIQSGTKFLVDFVYGSYHII